MITDAEIDRLYESTLKPRLEKLRNAIVWPGKPGVTAMAEVKPLTAEQRARFGNGKTLYAAVCAACHQANGRGLDGLAPPLLDSEWILGPATTPYQLAIASVAGVGDVRFVGQVAEHLIRLCRRESRSPARRAIRGPRASYPT